MFHQLLFQVDRLGAGRCNNVPAELALTMCINPKLRGWANYHIRARGERKRMKKLNGFVRERLRIFLKRKYSDEMRGSRRLHGNLLVRLGMFQFA
ncbi:hypothetical protein DJ031_03680 [bacterium endosymbiont of Escarpia laminata]|nr:MAG: hypothetical protein DJ031_03680 [bacterium endosymbiont of Escarpia laminata]